MAIPTRDEFIAFLKTKKVNTTCEACGLTNRWAIPSGNEYLLSVPIYQQGVISIPPPSIGAAIAVCDNCGNVRMHAATVVKP